MTNIAFKQCEVRFKDTGYKAILWLPTVNTNTNIEILIKYDKLILYACNACGAKVTRDVIRCVCDKNPWKA